MTRADLSHPAAAPADHPADWYSLSLGDAMLASQALAQVESAFRSAFEGAGRPQDMALFTRHESEGRLHCELVVYLSPGAAVVARKVGAEPCDPPLADTLDLVAGSASLTPATAATDEGDSG